VTGWESISVDYDAAQFAWAGKIVHRGISFSIDGRRGRCSKVESQRLIPTSRRKRTGRTCSGGPDEERRLQVWANADYPGMRSALDNSAAQGIGLDRTEHMFMETDRLDHRPRNDPGRAGLPRVSRDCEPSSRSSNREGREAGCPGEAPGAPGTRADRSLSKVSRFLEKLGGLQKKDFLGILRAMQGLPVIIRLIDSALMNPSEIRHLLVQVTKLTLTGQP